MRNVEKDLRNQLAKLSTAPWWQTAVFYQVYPRSFADGNGDGIGDIPGLISRLDYLQDLGIDAIWLSPHYPSPQVDCGYDIVDYCQVAPEYGTLDDFERLLDEVHQRNLRLVIDLVLNHTSDQHRWFQESRSGRDNPYRDWYIWHSGVNGRPPNNWVSAFGGSAWEYDVDTNQFYYHLFFKEQPDLNWRNPAVKDAMWKIAHFWLDLGVDGFRLDAIDTLFEHPDLPDHPVKRHQNDLRHYLLSASSEQRTEHGDQDCLFQHQVNQPGGVELIQELRQIVNQYEDRVLIGETDRMAFFGGENDGVHTLFNFPLMNMRQIQPAPVRQNQNTRYKNLPHGAWLANTLGNHDRPRTIQAHGDAINDQALARVTLTMLLTLHGTPFLYYGEEIGMTNLFMDDLDRIRDQVSLWVYQAALERGDSPPDALNLAIRYGRDQCRTPMQWSDAPNAGFCPEGVEPWLPVNPDHAQGVNVTDQLGNPDSILNFYRKLLRLRKHNLALQVGDIQMLHEDSSQYLAYLRHSSTHRQAYLVVLNFSGGVHDLDFRDNFHRLRCLFSTHDTKTEIYQSAKVRLVPYEVFIAEILSD
jgi:alpha-glucosidase